MNNSMTRTSRRKKRRRWPKRLASLIVILLILCALCGIFFTPLNNAWRNLTGNDTPADSMIKKTLITELNKQKNGNPQRDQAIQAATTAISATKMKTIMNAAENQQSANQLIQNASGISASTISQYTNAVYQTPGLDSVRSAISKGDWLGVYQAGQKAAQDPAVASQLQSRLGK